ncbi:hypothetical protein SRHO_G00201230, partial [Serrasalmus rhombeus]
LASNFALSGTRAARFPSAFPPSRSRSALHRVRLQRDAPAFPGCWSVLRDVVFSSTRFHLFSMYLSGPGCRLLTLMSALKP